MVTNKGPKTKKPKQSKTKKKLAKKGTARKIVKKKPSRRKEKKELKIGKVTHFYGKIKVAVVKLRASLRIGDRIKIQGGEREFEQIVKSMEVEHKKIKKALKGKEIGLKVKKKTREGDKVYKLQ